MKFFRLLALFAALLPTVALATPAAVTDPALHKSKNLSDLSAPASAADNASFKGLAPRHNRMSLSVGEAMAAFSNPLGWTAPRHRVPRLGLSHSNDGAVHDRDYTHSR